MSSTRFHGHPSLPAPVVHAGFSAHQSKSHVLAGVQDAYWSDDDADDADCPLCLEEMDISDLNFKPCVCGYQICRFCWHHIKQNLNGRCPACRREYTDDTVQFKPIAKEDHKRLTQQKKQRERERKELEILGRRHLANVRVVQRNVVYVVGSVPDLQRKSGTPVLGLYITYHRREDAARCISTVDGAPSPGGGREVMRASYGTTKYCMAFLRGVSCSDHTCMNLHEWGDEKDCFTKEDLTTLKHTIKDTESMSRTAKEGDGALPRAAAWGSKASTPQPQPTGTASTHSSSTITQRPNRRGGQRPPRNANANTGLEIKPSHRSTKTPSVTSSSRPPTPAAVTLPQRPATPPESVAPRPPVSPAPSLADVSPSPVRPRSTESMQSSPSVPPGILNAPPGLSGRPGLPPPTRKADPLTPPGIQPSQSTYQMSTAAQALLDDLKYRRENAPTNTSVNIFPDLDRTLRMVSGEDSEFGGFSFNLDPKLAGEDVNVDLVLPDMETGASVPFSGGFMPALRPTQPQPQMQHPRPEDQTTQPQGGLASTRKSPFPDEERKVSRFGFARGRRGSTAASSPIHAASPSDSHLSFFGETASSAQPHWNLPSHLEHGYTTSSPLAQHAQQQSQLQQYVRFQPFDDTIVSEAQLREFIQSSRERASSTYNGPAGRRLLFYQYALNQPFNDPAIMSARFASPVFSSAVPAHLDGTYPTTLSTEGGSHATSHIAPPPGLGFPPGLATNHAGNGNGTIPQLDSTRINPPRLNSDPDFSASPLPTLSSSDFPALRTVTGDITTTTATPSDAQSPTNATLTPDEISKEQVKADRKAAKKAAAVERALERQKAAQEKAAARAAEKARIAQEKAAEKERLVAIREEKEKVERERIEKERVERDRVAQELAAQVEMNAKADKEKRVEAETGDGREKAALGKSVKGPKASATLKKAIGTSTPKAERQTPVPPKAPELVIQAPILSKLPKKNKPVTRPIKVHKDDVAADETSAPLSTAASEASILPIGKNHDTVPSTPNVSRAQSVDIASPIERTSLADFFDELDVKHPSMDLPNHPLFDLLKINPAAKMPLEYGPLVHALSALSVGGGSIDNAVSSFQQLLETLTQTISDLLRLLPRTTWDDSSSFDGDDFLDDTGDDAVGKEDEVAALTLALERRARWMEVQLSKLEELHRDINTAAVRAVLAFNDSGWDRHGFMPRVGNTLKRFDNIGMVEKDGKMVPMTADELEKKLMVANEAAVFAETEFREAVEKMQAVRPVELDEY
ncbi:hypothetical protein BU15DRAFT_86156 [Melanogaster broomeanus]|nr:hypothetical protein BU15DRAFT_86156 [Melanogaster broomeanus]